MSDNKSQLETDKGNTNDQEPGLLENYGTFPVWMLKAIQLVTPSFLITQNPPNDDDTKSSSE